jgi:phosphoribosylaminoimidazole-succinocarboxamide synthase
MKMKGEKIVIETNLPLRLHSRGKVRDNYHLGTKLLMVATDRISAFDYVVGAIPGKGKNLTGLSAFWFRFTESVVKNHMISTDLSYANDHEVWTHAAEFDLEGRSMIVEKADFVIPVECVVRGYLAGSGWKEYQKTGMVCGHELPPGLREGDRLDKPIFTPATKAEAGMHDENITQEEMVKVLWQWLLKNDGIRYFAVTLAQKLESKSLELYSKARDYATARGIIIADTKFEYGIKDNRLTLIDEALTPDSSRFWPADKWQPGKTQDSFDKQYLRDWLESIGWNKKPPTPKLPAEVIQKTKEKYDEAANKLLT